MGRRPNPPPLPPEERYRMRRLTEEEMAHLCALARQGRHGPDAAMRALWDLIMREAEGVPAAQDAEPFSVQDYSIAADQNETIRAAMLEPRKVPKVADGRHPHDVGVLLAGRPRPGHRLHVDQSLEEVGRAGHGTRARLAARSVP